MPQDIAGQRWCPIPRQTKMSGACPAQQLYGLVRSSLPAQEFAEGYLVVVLHWVEPPIGTGRVAYLFDYREDIFRQDAARIELPFFLAEIVGPVNVLACLYRQAPAAQVVERSERTGRDGGEGKIKKFRVLDQTRVAVRENPRTGFGI